jgi:hypothetical protein
MNVPERALPRLLNQDRKRGELTAKSIGALAYKSALRQADPEKSAHLFEGAEGMDPTDTLREMLMLRIIATCQGIDGLMRAVAQEMLAGFWDAHREQMGDPAFAAFMGDLSAREEQYVGAFRTSDDTAARGLRVGQVFARAVGVNEKDPDVWLPASIAFGTQHQVGMITVADLLGELWKNVGKEFL